MVFVKAEFGGVEGLAAQIANTVASIDQEREDWRLSANAARIDWLDQAGGDFGIVADQWDKVQDLQAKLLAQVGIVTSGAADRYRETVANAASRFV